MIKILNILIFTSVIFLTMGEAKAYLDPGTGSMVVQILIAAFATALIFFKSIYANIKCFFTGKKPPQKTEDEEE